MRTASLQFQMVIRSGLPPSWPLLLMDSVGKVAAVPMGTPSLVVELAQQCLSWTLASLHHCYPIHMSPTPNALNLIEMKMKLPYPGVPNWILQPLHFMLLGPRACHLSADPLQVLAR